MTFAMLNTNTNKVITRSNVRLESEPSSPNIRADPLTAPKVVKYLHVENDDT